MVASWVGHSIEVFSSELKQRGWKPRQTYSTLAHVRSFLDWAQKPLTHLTEQDARIFALELTERTGAARVQEARSALDLFYRYSLNKHTQIAS